MGLETFTGYFLDELSQAAPADGDFGYGGDNHLRNLKKVLQTTFPNIDAAVTPTPTELNYVGGVTSSIQTQLTTNANAITALQGSLEAAVGTKMLFYSAAAPTGWASVALNDRMIRVVTTATTGGSTGGTDSPILMNKVPSHTHSGTTGNQNANHTHSWTAYASNGSISGTSPGNHTDFTNAQGHTTSANSANHGHAFTTSSQSGTVGNWTPKYADVTIGSKT